MIASLFFLVAAAFFAGLIDSVAGGGGLISLPALLACGMPAHLALGTNKFQSTLGTAVAAINFHRKAKILWKIALVGVPCSFAGSVFGAKMALFVEQTMLAKILVVILPPSAALIFASRALLKHKTVPAVSPVNFWVLTPLMCAVIGIYDGFFGPGTGTFLIVGLVLVSHLPLINASATAKTFNLASNIGAFITFLLAHEVNLLIGALMAGGNILGNYIGSHYAIKHGSALVNKIVCVSLALLFVYLAVKYF